MPKIRELELELFDLNRELEDLNAELTDIECLTVLDVIILAENISKSKGKNNHELSRTEKRDAEIRKRLKANPEWIKLTEHKADLLRDLEFTRIDIDFLKREFQRSLKN